MWIEQRQRKKGTIFKVHIKKIDNTNGDEIKVSRSFKTRKEAETWGKHTESDIERGSHTNTHKVDSHQLNEFLRLYINHLTPEPGQQPRKVGWRQEVNRLKVWQRHRFAKRPISKVLPQDLLAYIIERRADCSARSRPDEPPRHVSDATIKQELNALSNAYRFAIDHCGLEVSNPVKSLPRSSKPAPSRHIDVRITPADWKRLEPLLAARRNPLYVIASELAIETGLRQGELLRLERNDVHITKPAHIIARDYVQSGGRVANNSRAVPLSNRAISLVKHVLKLIPGDQQVLFASVSADGLSRAFRQDCETANVRDTLGYPATFHATRHEAISRMASYIQINHLQKISGHKTMSQLQRYYNPTITDLAAHFVKRKTVQSTRS